MAHPSIILINPQMGENIGGAARAMLNCCLDDLNIVNPRDGWPNERADAMSSGALEKMPPVGVYSNTAEAIADCHYVYATTARPRDMVKPVFTAEEATNDMAARIANGQKCAVLFGGERAGLDNDDVARAHAIITIPLNPDFTSLNLAQAVLLVSYEFSKHIDSLRPQNIDVEPASAEDMNNLFLRLENALDEKGFFHNKHRQSATMRNIKNMISRAELTDQEVRTYHGIISMLIKNDS